MKKTLLSWSFIIVALIEFTSCKHNAAYVTSNQPASWLDIYAAHTTNGTKVEIWTSNGGSNQKFQFIKQ